MSRCCKGSSLAWRVVVLCVGVTCQSSWTVRRVQAVARRPRDQQEGVRRAVTGDESRDCSECEGSRDQEACPLQRC